MAVIDCYLLPISQTNRKFFSVTVIDCIKTEIVYKEKYVFKNAVGSISNIRVFRNLQITPL